VELYLKALSLALYYGPVAMLALGTAIAQSDARRRGRLSG